MRVCKVSDCSTIHRSKGYCKKHYQRFVKHGDVNVDKRYKHGLSNSSTYISWAKMVDRCKNTNSTAYYHYGERGLTVVDEWLDFRQFYKDMGERPSKSHTIDRIDTLKGYSPDNCRWATRKEQSRNTKLSKRNKSGYKGVFWFSECNRWVAYIMANGKRHHLGLFKDIGDAVSARRNAELKLWKES